MDGETQIRLTRSMDELTSKHGSRRNTRSISTMHYLDRIGSNTRRP